MTTNTISRIIARISRRSSTANAPVRPDRHSSAPVTLRASPKRTSNADSTPTSDSAGLNQATPAPHRSPSNRHTVTKSP
jgi:hypothetical protein